MGFFEDNFLSKSKNEKIGIVCCGCVGGTVLFMLFGMMVGNLPAYSDNDIIGTATLDMCVVDYKNADLWEGDTVNLWKYPGGLATDGQKIVTKIPACDGIVVDILDTYTDENGLEYYKIGYNSKAGWMTKRMFTGEV